MRFRKFVPRSNSQWPKFRRSSKSWALYRPRSLVDFAKDAIKEKFKFYKRTQYLLILTFCMTLLIVQVGISWSWFLQRIKVHSIVFNSQGSQCVKKFLKASTGTGDKYVHVSKTNFPVPTFCPAVPYRPEVFQSSGTFSDQNQNERICPDWVPFHRLKISEIVTNKWWQIVETNFQKSYSLLMNFSSLIETKFEILQKEVTRRDDCSGIAGKERKERAEDFLWLIFMWPYLWNSRVFIVKYIFKGNFLNILLNIFFITSLCKIWMPFIN